MTILKTVIATALLLANMVAVCLAGEATGDMVTMRIVAQDPQSGATLATSDRLYLHLSYNSPVPVRFQVEAFRQGVLQEKSFTNSAPPYDAGHGDALAWISFPFPLSIDEIRVVAFDLEWKRIGALTVPMTLTWEFHDTETPRELEVWIGPMQKHHRHVFDTALDPQPQKPEPFFEFFLLGSIASIPLYLFLQIRMLIICKDGWRKYALVPLVPIAPLVLYSLIGLGIESTYWIIFLTRYFPVAAAYLGGVWLVKRIFDKPHSEETTS